MNGRQFGMPSEPERPSTAHSLERVSAPSPVPQRVVPTSPIPVPVPEPIVDEDDDDDDDFDFEAIRNLDREIESKPKPKPKSKFKFKSKTKTQPKAVAPEKRVVVEPPRSEYVERPKPEKVSQPVSSAPKPKKAKSRGSWRIIVAGLAGVIVVVGAAAILMSVVPRSASAEPTGIDGTNYQAVFFTNGQVYFGKLAPFNSGYMKLQDIYYLQSASAAGDTKDAQSTNPQSTTKNQGDVQLIKLGDEVHGPKDEMYLAKDQILFFENLKPDSKVAKSIAEYKRMH